MPSVPPRPAGHGTAAGFTLLELLVALSVLGMLLVGLAQGMRLGLRAWEAQERMLSRQGDLVAVDRALRRLVEQMHPGSEARPARLVGGAGGMAFVTELPMAAGTLPTRRAEVALLVASGRLVLRWTPRLHARGAAPPSVTETELLRGIERLELAYLHPGTAAGGGVWVSAWEEPTLPALLRIRLVFPPGDPRRWPDILAAPRAERPEE